ncbi:hypothetical protein RZO55_00945, partial [Clostridium boliviensis]
ASFATRVSRILDIYLRGETDLNRLQKQVSGAISRIERRLSPDVRKELASQVEERNWRRGGDSAEGILRPPLPIFPGESGGGGDLPECG